jgi:hypothetical protein
MENGLIDHQKNLDLFLKMSIYDLKLSKKVLSILSTQLYASYVKPKLYNLILFLMSNGNKRISTLMNISEQTKKKFKLLRSIGFSVVDPKTGKILSENANILNYRNLMNLLTNDGKIKYFDIGAIIPTSDIPKYTWLCFSEKKIQSILKTIKQENSPILMASKFITFITNNLNLSNITRKKASPHSIFTKQCNQLHYYQKKKGGLLYKYPLQRVLSLRWVFKLEDEFRSGNVNAVNTTLHNIRTDLNCLILPISTRKKKDQLKLTM